MPLWYHPPAVPVNLGAPVYPGPLLYHPAPILVDPRPQHAHDTLYCACQFSLGPAPAPHLQWSSTAAAPPAITPLSERPSTVRKHSSWAGPSGCSGPTGPAVDVDVERSTTHDVRTLNIRLSGGHLHAHYTPPNHNATAAAARAVSLDKATVERIRAEIRNDLERVRTRENGQAQAQAQAQQAPTAQPETTRPHDEHIKHDLAAPLNELPEDEKEKLAKMRDKVRKELSAAYDEKMKALEARELDIQRRMDAIRKREAQWIESYGEGVIKGKPAESTRHQSAPSLSDQTFISDLDDASASDPPGTPSPSSPHQTPRPMRWLFGDHELKSYPSSPPPRSAADHASTAGDSSSSHDDTPTSPQSSTLHAEKSTTNSVNAHIAHLTGAAKPAGLFGKASHAFISRPSSRVDEETNANMFRDVPNTDGTSCYNFDFFDAGPSRQPWKWFETGRAKNASKGALMGPTYNISSLIPRPEGISLKRTYDGTGDHACVAGNTNHDTVFQQKLPSSSSCSSSYVSALRDITLDNSPPKQHNPTPKPASKTRGSKDSPPLSQRTTSSQSTVIKTPQTSPAEKGLPQLRDHFTAAASPLTLKREYPPHMSAAAAATKQPVYDAATPHALPLVKKEPSVSDLSEMANLEDRDFSFCEPFYDWSIHDCRLHKNEGIGGELPAAAAPPPRSGTLGSCNFEFGESSDLSSNLFHAAKYMMRGARLAQPDNTGMAGGELKWPPSPTVYTLSSTSSSDTDEPRHAPNTTLEADEDLLLPSTKRTLNPHRSPTKKPVPQEQQSHILDEPIVFARNPYLQFHSPPITPTKPHSPAHAHADVVAGDKSETVFTLPPRATGHELCITISRSVTPTSTHSDDAPPPAEHLDGSTDEHGRKKKKKCVKSVHWGASTDAERRFAEEEGMSYYEVEGDSDDDEEEEEVYDWSDDGEEGDDEGYDEGEEDDEEE